jgi:tetratricopeptide (TPR) repeat protein
MRGFSSLGYRTRIALAIFLGLVAALGIDVKSAHSQTKEAQSLVIQSIELREQGRYSEAIPLAQRALAIREKSLGPDHPAVANALSNLAGMYYTLGRYVEAEPLYKRALAIREKAGGPNHPDVGVLLDNLALLFKVQGRYAEAEQLNKRALAVLRKALGPNHLDVATSLDNLACTAARF